MTSVADGISITPGAEAPDLHITKEPSEIVFQKLLPVAHSETQTEWEIESPGPTFLLDPLVLMQTIIRVGNAAAAVANQVGCKTFPASWRMIDSISVTWKGMTYSYAPFGDYATILASTDCSIQDAERNYSTAPHISQTRSPWKVDYTWNANVPINIVSQDVQADVLTYTNFYQTTRSPHYAAPTWGGNAGRSMMFEDPLPIFPFRYSANQSHRYAGLPFVDRISVAVVWKGAAALTGVFFNSGAEALGRGGISDTKPQLLLKWINRPQTASPLQDKYLLSGLPQYEYYTTTKTFAGEAGAVTPTLKYPTMESDVFVLRGIPTRIWCWVQPQANVYTAPYRMADNSAFRYTVFFNGKMLNAFGVTDMGLLWQKNTYPNRYCSHLQIMHQDRMLLLRSEDLTPLFSNVREKVSLSVQWTHEFLVAGGANLAPGARTLAILVEYGDGVLEISRTSTVLHAPPVIDRGMVDGGMYKTSESQHTF